MKITEKFVRLKLFLRVLVWIFCTSLLFYLFVGVFHDYNQRNPITVITFVDTSFISTPVIIKICNENYLDKNKILNDCCHNYESYQFLREAMLGNENFNDTNRLLQWINGPLFFLSSGLLQHLALDLDEFLLACFSSTSDCSNYFHLYQEPFTPCYEATIDMKHFDRNNGISLYFYFDPNVTMGKYNEDIGAYVRVGHEGQYIPTLEGMRRQFASFNLE